MSDPSLQRTEGVILITIAVVYVLAYAIRRLRRTRPDFSITTPLVVGFALRVLVVIAINATGSLQAQLRGGDETTFLGLARTLAGTPWGRGFLPHGPYQLQTDVFAAQIKLLHVDNTALRMTQIGISMLGFILILVSVYDLGGARPARLGAWILAFEPASLFFNSAIHKEPLMLLASGLVVFGGTKIWRRFDLTGIVWCVLGGVIAVSTRSYAGWFLVSAAVFVLLHASLRRLHRPGMALPVIYAIAIAGFLVTPTLVTITSNKSLQTLQQSQNANTGVGGPLQTGTANSNNLADETVNFSTRGQVITNLPKRVFDLIFRPYPWQLQDISQQLGAIASLLALFGLALLLFYGRQSRGHFFELVSPMLYPFFFLLIAYSLSAGNAGTGFRYRTHLVVLGVAMLVLLRENALKVRAEAREAAISRAAGGPELLPQEPLPA